jgi:hypothetical protein
MILANDHSPGVIRGGIGAKQLGVSALLALLVGCASTTPSATTDSKYQNLMATARLAFHHPRLPEPTVASVEAKPFYQLEAISPDGQAILNMAGEEGDLQGWYGPAGQAIFLEHGLVVRTIGLKQNLDDTHWPSENPFAAGLQTLPSNFNGVRVVDWSPGYRYGVPEDVHLMAAGMEDVNILGSIHHLQRIDETVSAPIAGFVARNHYWVDPADGFIWKSHQVVVPGLTLDLIQLRPYRKGKP